MQPIYLGTELAKLAGCSMQTLADHARRLNVGSQSGPRRPWRFTRSEAATLVGEIMLTKPGPKPKTVDATEAAAV